MGSKMYFCKKIPLPHYQESNGIFHFLKSVYNQIFLKVRSMIMSAWRQESIGTIIMGFYLGVKVFMSERSPLYKWFVDCGFNVFAIETAKEEDLDTPLSIKDKQRNREIVLERYNEERIARSLKENIVD